MNWQSAVMRNGWNELPISTSLSQVHGGNCLLLSFYFWVVGFVCTWMGGLTCVQGGSLFPSPQGWVLSVLKTGMSCHFFCLVIGEFSVVLNLIPLCLSDFGIQVCVAF